MRGSGRTLITSIGFAKSGNDWGRLIREQSCALEGNVIVHTGLSTLYTRVLFECACATMVRVRTTV